MHVFILCTKNIKIFFSASFHKAFPQDRITINMQVIVSSYITFIHSYIEFVIKYLGMASQHK